METTPPETSILTQAPSGFPHLASLALEPGGGGGRAGAGGWGSGEAGREGRRRRRREGETSCLIISKICLSPYMERGNSDSFLFLPHASSAPSLLPENRLTLRIPDESVEGGEGWGKAGGNLENGRHGDFSFSLCLAYFFPSLLYTCLHHQPSAPSPCLHLHSLVYSFLVSLPFLVS